MPANARTALLVSVLVGLAPGCSGMRIFAPDDRVSDSSKDQPGPSPSARPGRYSVRVAPYVFLSDFELKPDNDLFRDLADLRDQVYRELQLPTSERPILVYLFEDRDRYEQFMSHRYPGLPQRRAYFVAQPRAMGGEDLLVFTYRSERIRQDLRHELTHALLHSVLKGVPLWLDEGLAEYFELPPERNGVNDSHLNHIRRSVVEPFRPRMARLENLEQVGDMTPAEYREAWAWVHYLLRGGNPGAKSALLAYLQQLRTTDKAGQLRPRLARAVSDPETEMQQHISRLDFGVKVLPAAHR